MFDVKAWAADPVFGFSDEEQADLLSKFSTDARVKGLEGNQLRQTDYSKQMNDGQATLDALRVKHEEADAKLNRELGEWATVQGASAEKVAAADARIRALEQDKLTARQTIERIAQDQGLDPKPYLEGLQTTPADPGAGTPPTGTPPVTPEPPDLTPFAKAKDVAQVNRLLHLQPFELQTISNEHLALTGESLDAMALHAEVTRRAAANENIDSLRTVWETLHDIPAKRTAKATAKYKADITAAEERGRAGALTEHAIPTGSPAGHRAVIFQPPANADGTPRRGTQVLPRAATAPESRVGRCASLGGRHLSRGAQGRRPDSRDRRGVGS